MFGLVGKNIVEDLGVNLGVEMTIATDYPRQPQTDEVENYRVDAGVKHARVEMLLTDKVSGLDPFYRVVFLVQGLLRSKCTGTQS